MRWMRSLQSGVSTLGEATWNSIGPTASLRASAILLCRRVSTVSLALALVPSSTST